MQTRQGTGLLPVDTTVETSTAGDNYPRDEADIMGR